MLPCKHILRGGSCGRGVAVGMGFIVCPDILASSNISVQMKATAIDGLSYDEYP